MQLYPHTFSSDQFSFSYSFPCFHFQKQVNSTVFRYTQTVHLLLSLQDGTWFGNIIPKNHTKIFSRFHIFHTRLGSYKAAMVQVASHPYLSVTIAQLLSSSVFFIFHTVSLILLLFLSNLFLFFSSRKSCCLPLWQSRITRLPYQSTSADRPR